MLHIFAQRVYFCSTRNIGHHIHNLRNYATNKIKTTAIRTLVLHNKLKTKNEYILIILIKCSHLVYFRIHILFAAEIFGT